MGVLRRIVPLAVFVVTVTGCGGGGGSHHSSPTESTTPTPRATVASPAPTATPGSDNVQSLIVDPGPNGTYVNGLFASVTICVPGSATCGTVDHVLVDTGSSGLRILSSALALALPTQADPGGSPVAECFPFLDSFTWGPLRVADVTIAGETASSVPLQIIGDPTFAPPPDACTSSGLSPADTLATLGAKGILGIGVFRQDCGAFCASSGGASGNVYFSCAATGCTPISEPVDAQVQNPVWLLPQDSNGVVIDLPSVPDRGAPSVTGTLTIGIGTRGNNALDSATVLPLTNAGTFTTVFDSQSFTVSFVDTGSNGVFFLDTATTSIPTCAANSDFYCPSSTLTLQATQRDTTDANTSVAVTFDVANAVALFNNTDAFAYHNLAGPGPNMFDWGLPFFYGRRVFIAIEGQTTPAGPGPYIAY